MGKVYHYETTITIGETDLTGNVYYLHMMKLQAVIRELWVKDNVPDALKQLKNGLGLITRDVSCRFFHSLKLYSEVMVTFQTRRVRHTSVELVFRLYDKDNGRLCAEGMNMIGFVDSKTGRLCKMPESFRLAALEYRESSNEKRNEVLPIKRRQRELSLCCA